MLKEEVKDIETALKYIEHLFCNNNPKGPADMKYFSNLDEESALLETHHSLSQELRNDLSLWDKDSTMYKYFFNKWKIFHADDMSSILITCFYRELNNENWHIEKQVQEYLDYWKNENGKD